MTEPKYEGRAKPNTHTAESLDRSKLSRFVLKLLEQLESLDILLPKNGEGYSNHKIRYNIEDDITIRLTERQLNLANLSAKGYDNAKYELFVKAGYNFYAVFAKEGNWNNVKQIKQELTSKYDVAKTDTISQMINHLRYNGAVELHIDAKWLLNEQVDMYTECRRAKMYTQAVRLLHDISYHVDVDARVSTKLEIETSIDYAAMLAAADNRIKSLPQTESSDVVEGEYTVEVLEEPDTAVSPVETE